MSRPLVISDCDEVLLHMVAPFRDWLAEEQGVDFRLEGANFAESMRRQDTGERLEEPEIWRLLGGFFDTEMHRQTPIAGSVGAMNRLMTLADVVILTNLNDERQEKRTQQLLDHGIDARVFTNQGPKGDALARIVSEYGATKAFFIDDLAIHHQSAAETVPDLHRLHFVGEPGIAPNVPCALEAGHAHARIDRWDEALPYLLDRLEEEAA